MNVTLIPFAEAHRAAYIHLYETAFPPEERKPFDFMTHGPASGAYDLWTVSVPDTAVAGLAITVRRDDLVLLDYLAIAPALRGQGLGHKVLPLIREQYPHRHLFLEIESPVPSAANLSERLRRKAFYTSAGLTDCGIRAHIYDTTMELWAYPADVPFVTFEAYAALVAACFPPDMTPLPL